MIMIQTIWASLLVLGLLRVAIFIILDAILWRLQPLIGLLGFVLFLAYLLHWI